MIPISARSGWCRSYNVDLANSLGNLLNRTLNMAQKYSKGKLTLFNTEPPLNVKPDAVIGTYQQRMWDFEIHAALAHVGDFSTACNTFIENKAPWKMAKDPAQTEELAAVLYTLAESLRIIAILISPVLPKAAHGIFDQLQWKLDEAGKESRFKLADAQWGGLPDGHVLGKPVPLFPRIEEPKA